jgi:hypothetical protein
MDLLSLLLDAEVVKKTAGQGNRLISGYEITATKRPFPAYGTLTPGAN